MTLILKASEVRSNDLENLKRRTDELKSKGVTPTLKVLLVGNNPASVLYTNNKKKYIESFGGSCEIIKLSEDISESDFREEVKKITTRDDVHGAFVQLPLPKALSHIDVGALIPGKKDADGLSPENMYKLIKFDKSALLPCTPKGIMTLLDHYNINVEGKKACVIGRSMIVGKPMALMLTNKNATVTLCHSRTKNLKEVTQNSEIIVSAIGSPKLITKEFIGDNKPVVIDVGMNYDQNGKLCGDVDFDNVKELCSAITPVPGGVGPMTIHSLAQNLLQATENSLN